jgi:hypothetical protein
LRQVGGFSAVTPVFSTNKIGADCTGSCKFSKSNQNFITGDKVKLLFESVETKDSKAMVVLLCNLIISS